jgi:spore coat protein U-like protein
MKRLLLALLVALTCSYAPQLLAGSATASLQVSVVVDQSCIVSTSPLVFATYNPFASTPDDSTGTVTIQCGVGSVVTIGLDCGTSCSGTNAYLHSGVGGLLPYSLYQDGSHTTPWGNTPSTQLAPPTISSTSPHPYTVYGRIAAGQTASPGTYTDTVVATVNF